MGLLASGQSMLGQVMTAEGQSITYRRRTDSVPLMAMPDGPLDPNETSDGISISRNEVEFAINFSDIATIGLPEDGDMISWFWGGTTYLYKVLQTEQTRCYEWLDNRHLRLSVHTKFQGTQ